MARSPTPKPERPKAERVVAALDVGSSKVAALIVVAGGDDETPRVLGFGQRACQGLKRGLVADMERAETAIRAALDQAERAAGIRVEDAIVNLSAGGLDSDVTSVEVDIAGHRIERADIDHVLAEGRARLDAGGRTILHAQPTLYTIDGLTGVANPYGFHAHRLGVDIHVVTAETPPLRNLDLVVRAAHLGVKAVVASGAASGLAVLGAEERDLGCALIEIGGGVTSVAVFAGGLMVGVAAIPLGGQDITDAVAAAFGARRVHAERIKTLKGSAVTTPSDNHDMLEIPRIVEEDGAEPRRIPRAQLIGVIRQQLEVLFGRVADELKTLGFAGSAAGQVVLTGGGAELKGIADYAQGALGRPVRLGPPRGLVGLPETQAGCALATVAGLALWGLSDGDDLLARVPETTKKLGTTSERRSPLGKMFDTLKRNM